MKILVVNYEFPPLGGGGGVASFNLARELAKGHQVDCITTAYQSLPASEEVDGVNVYRVPVIGRRELSTASILSMVSFFPVSLFKGIRLCRENRYDVISSHFVIPSGLSGVLLSKLFGVPGVVSIYGGDVYDPSKKTSPHRSLVLRALISWLFRQSDRIVAESENIKTCAERYYRPGKPIEVIPVGFVPPEVRSKQRSELGLKGDATYIISVGRLVKRKGYDTAIRAIGKLSYPNVMYLIVGDGPEEGSLKALVKELRAEDRIVFLGRVGDEEKYQYLENADIYLLTSSHEGFGICLMEAMYAGLPIVATDNGGQTDFLQAGKNALFVAVDDIAGTAEKLAALIERADERREMGVRNREDLRQLHVERIASRYESLLSGLMNG